MDEREIESLDEAIDELLSLGYLRYVEPDKLLEVTELNRSIELETQNIGEEECWRKEEAE